MIWQYPSAPPICDSCIARIANGCTYPAGFDPALATSIKSPATALLLSGQIGGRFEAIATGASAKGTWVRLINPPVEGRLARGMQGLDVGDHVCVRLLSTDVQHGFIAFARA